MKSDGINIYGSPRPFFGGEGLGVRGRGGGSFVDEKLVDQRFDLLSLFLALISERAWIAIRFFTQGERDSDPLPPTPSPPTPLPRRGRGEPCVCGALRLMGNFNTPQVDRKG